MNIQMTSPMGFVLRELTWGARVFTVEQIQRILDARFEGFGSAQQLLRRLAAENVVELDRTAATFYEAHEPIGSWAPLQPALDFDALAWQLEKRWRHVRTRRVTICWATAQAARLLGGVAAFTGRASQLEHDLGTASVLVRLRETRPDLSGDWIGEDILRRDFAPWCPSMKKIPDGAIVRHNMILSVAEYGGQYSAARLRRFHAHFKKHRIKYCLW